MWDDAFLAFALLLSSLSSSLARPLARCDTFKFFFSPSKRALLPSLSHSTHERMYVSGDPSRTRGDRRCAVATPCSSSSTFPIYNFPSAAEQKTSISSSCNLLHISYLACSSCPSSSIHVLLSILIPPRYLTDKRKNLPRSPLHIYREMYNPPLLSTTISS